MERCILYKKYQCFVLDEVCISSQEAHACGVGKRQFHGSGCLDFSHVRLCIVHTVIGDKHCSKTYHSTDNLQYHNPSSAGQQLVHQKAQPSLNEEMNYPLLPNYNYRFFSSISILIWKENILTISVLIYTCKCQRYIDCQHGHSFRLYSASYIDTV